MRRQIYSVSAIIIFTGLLACPLSRAIEADIIQAQFTTPEEAVKAFTSAAKTFDKEAILKIFGPVAKEIANPDAVEAKRDWAELSRHIAEYTNLVKDGESATLYIGAANWPFPVPIKSKEGKWYFDTAAGKEEILNRRIGQNELDTITVCREYVIAQRAYSTADRDSDDIVEYAQKFRSSPGKKDGLYWKAMPEELQSPFGPLAAKAYAAGYSREKVDSGDAPEPFHGYYFRILTRQGDKAPGGAYDYVINGHMVAGFALIAYPAEWGNSGIMTFILNQRGKVLQKNLGEKTAELVAEIKEYNPDDSWTVVKDNEND